MLLDNVETCINNHKVFEDESFANQLTNAMIPISTAYQLNVYTMFCVLCDLFCDDEKDGESSDKSNEIVLADGQSLTVYKGEHRIEINDNGIRVSNLEKSK